MGDWDDEEPATYQHLRVQLKVVTERSCRLGVLAVMFSGLGYLVTPELWAYPFYGLAAIIGLFSGIGWCAVVRGYRLLWFVTRNSR